MNRTCRNCADEFTLTPDDLEFYAKIAVPFPTWCPDCRMLRRMAHCNESELYTGTCSGCSKRIVSQYAPGAPWPVYCINCWWSDKWRGQDYGREIDFSRSMLEQFHELELSVPHACVSTDIINENSDYTHHAGQEKNCYFIFHASVCEDCYYGYGVKKARNCVDVHNCFESELCYECVDVDHCYGLKWSQDCYNCSDSSFIRDCVGCQNCFLCVGLRNQQYCFENRKLSREEYEKRIAGIDLGSYSSVARLLGQFKTLQLQHHWRNLQSRSVESSRGDYLINADRSYDCFDCRDVERCSHCAQLQLGSRFSYDIYQFGFEMELCYEGAMVGRNAYNVHFGSLCIWQVSNLTYCIDCYSTNNCLLSFGLRNGRHCILNREYDEQTYKTLRARIIEKMTADGEYGEFFPVEYSQFAYNETTAQRWFPRTKEQVMAKGWRWKDELPGTRGKETLRELPDAINAVPDSIIKELLACSDCGRNFKLTAQELAFYRRQQIPLPRNCFGCRRHARSAQRNPRKFWQRNCADCGRQIVSTYDPAGPQKVSCEACYNKFVLG